MSLKLSDEEKKYLKYISNYLGSYNTDYGFVTIHDIDNIDWDILKDLNLNRFNNNYDIEIPLKLQFLIKKIIKYIIENDMLPDTESSEEYWHYAELEIEINRKNNTIFASYDYQTTEAKIMNAVVYKGSSVADIFESLEGISSDNGLLELSYEGSGDDGYIADVFNDTTEEVPEIVSSWCYEKLENTFGGWEDNEGSQGNFIFDLSKKTITWNHINFEAEGHSKTIWEENF